MSAERELRDWIEAEKSCTVPVNAAARGWSRLKKAVHSGDSPLAVPLSIDPSRSSALVGYSLLALVVGALGTTAYLASASSAPPASRALHRHLPPPDDEPHRAAHIEPGQPGPAPSITVPLGPPQAQASQRALPKGSDPPPKRSVEPTAEAPPQPRARRSAAASAEPEAATSLDDELRLITNAKAALDRGDLRAATASLSEHRARFPSGFLAAERDALKLLVSCNHQKPSDAASLVEGFVRRYPESPLLDRIRRACLDPSSSRNSSRGNEVE